MRPKLTRVTSTSTSRSLPPAREVSSPVRSSGRSASGRGAVKYRVAAGRLHPIPGHRAVFLVGHAARTPRTMYWAAHLAVGPSSVISHRSAAALRQLRASGAAFVELTVPGPEPAARRHPWSIGRRGCPRATSPRSTVCPSRPSRGRCSTSARSCRTAASSARSTRRSWRTGSTSATSSASCTRVRHVPVLRRCEPSRPATSPGPRSPRRISRSSCSPSCAAPGSPSRSASTRCSSTAPISAGRPRGSSPRPTVPAHDTACRPRPRRPS